MNNVCIRILYIYCWNGCFFTLLENIFTLLYYELALSLVASMCNFIQFAYSSLA